MANPDCMNTATALRALADHLDRHPQLLNGVTSVKPAAYGRPFRVQIYSGNATIAGLLRWHATIGTPVVTAELYVDDVHLTMHGLMDGMPVEVVDVASLGEADLLRVNLALTDKPTAVPVHRLRALVDASVAEHVERPIVDPALIGGAR